MHQILAQYNLMGRSPPLFRRPINLYARMQTEREKKKTERKKKNKRKKKRKKFRGTRKRETAHLGSLRAAAKQSKTKESVCVCVWGRGSEMRRDGSLECRRRPVDTGSGRTAHSWPPDRARVALSYASSGFFFCSANICCLLFSLFVDVVRINIWLAGRFRSSFSFILSSIVRWT